MLLENSFKALFNTIRKLIFSHNHYCYHRIDTKQSLSMKLTLPDAIMYFMLLENSFKALFHTIRKLIFSHNQYCYYRIDTKQSPSMKLTLPW